MILNDTKDVSNIKKIEIVEELLITLRHNRPKDMSDLDDNCEQIKLKDGRVLQYVRKAFIEEDSNGYWKGFFDTLCFVGIVTPPSAKYNDTVSNKHFMGTNIFFKESDIVDYSDIESDTNQMIYIYDNLEDEQIKMLELGRVARKGLTSLNKKRM